MSVRNKVLGALAGAFTAVASTFSAMASEAPSAKALIEVGIDPSDKQINPLDKPVLEREDAGLEDENISDFEIRTVDGEKQVRGTFTTSQSNDNGEPSHVTFNAPEWMAVPSSSSRMLNSFGEKTIEKLAKEGIEVTGHGGPLDINPRNVIESQVWAKENSLDISNLTKAEPKDYTEPSSVIVNGQVQRFG